jgi:hypothetical protein
MKQNDIDLANIRTLRKRIQKRVNMAESLNEATTQIIT